MKYKKYYFNMLVLLWTIFTALIFIIKLRYFIEFNYTWNYYLIILFYLFFSIIYYFMISFIPFWGKHELEKYST